MNFEEPKMTIRNYPPRGNAVEMKWVKFNVPIDIHDKFKQKAASEGYSLYEASRQLVFRYVRGDFDIGNGPIVK